MLSARSCRFLEQLDAAARSPSITADPLFTKARTLAPSEPTRSASASDRSAHSWADVHFLDQHVRLGKLAIDPGQFLGLPEGRRPPREPLLDTATGPMAGRRRIRCGPVIGEPRDRSAGEPAIIAAASHRPAYAAASSRRSARHAAIDSHLEKLDVLSRLGEPSSRQAAMLPGLRRSSGSGAHLAGTSRPCRRTVRRPRRDRSSKA